MDSPFLISGLVFIGMVIGLYKLFAVLGNGFSQEVILNQQITIDNYLFPSSVAGKVAEAYPHLSASQIESVVRGLRDFFHICREAGAVMVAMPSQVVDVAWHEFILSTKSYEDFCQNAFGRFLHHTPARGMIKTGKESETIKRTWRLACEREGIHPRKPDRLPLLFALDADLNIPGGLTYSLDGKKAGSHKYYGSHTGCTGAGSGTGDFVSSSSSYGETGGDSFGSGCSSSCGGGCGGGD